MYLCSEFSYVASSVAKKLGDDIHKPAVFLMTPLSDKKRSDQELDFHYKNKEALKNIGINYDFYDIVGKSESEIINDLDKYELMYVEGGNPFFLLQESRKNNFAQYLQERVNNGLIYISTSAGSLIMGRDIESVSRPGKTAKDYGVTDTTAFNTVNFNIHPHWGKPSKHDLYMDYKIPQSYQDDYPYILISNDQYIEVDGDWHYLVDVRNDA